MTGRRLFIALPVADRLAAEHSGSIYRALDKYNNILKTVTPVNLHITMKFLGDVDEDTGAKMIELFSSLEAPGRINYILKGLGCFPSISSPSVIWGGIECDMKKMSDLFSRIEEFCATFGFNKETRRFVPHLTFARVRRGKDVPSVLKDFIRSSKEQVYGESVFDRLVRFESRLDKSGPEYISLAEVRFI